MENFSQEHSINAYDKIPVKFFTSKRTGLTVVLASTEGPIVSGFFCVGKQNFGRERNRIGKRCRLNFLKLFLLFKVTEAFDEDGLPHTLEHLIFGGSEDYPYKDILHLLANRCLSSGVNAWTATDYTCFKMETAGSEGFLTLLPIYLDHILYPTLTVREWDSFEFIKRKSTILGGSLRYGSTSRDRRRNGRWCCLLRNTGRRKRYALEN